MERLKDDDELSVYSFGYWKHGQTGTNLSNGPFKIPKFDCDMNEGIPIKQVASGGNLIFSLLVLL